MPIDAGAFSGVFSNAAVPVQQESRCPFIPAYVVSQDGNVDRAAQRPTIADGTPIPIFSPNRVEITFHKGACALVALSISLFEKMIRYLVRQKGGPG